MTAWRGRLPVLSAVNARRGAPTSFLSGKSSRSAANGFRRRSSNTRNRQPEDGGGRLLVFGHAGITLGAVTLLNGLATGAISKRKKVYAKIGPEDNTPRKSPPGWLTAGFTHLGRRWDIRILLVGSLLPDIIDKPLGQVVFRESISTGRIFFHTLLFTIVMALGGLFLRYRTGKTWLLVLSVGTFAHLILDEMWQQESLPTLLWPLYGLEFPRAELTDWVGNIWQALLHNPAVYIPEIIGGVIIILFLWVLLRNGTLINFIRHGRLTKA